MSHGRDWRRARYSAINTRELGTYYAGGGSKHGKNAPWCELSDERKAELGLPVGLDEFGDAVINPGDSEDIKALKRELRELRLELRGES